MRSKPPEHALEFLLDFDGRRHFYEGGYFAKFEIRRVSKTKTRPAGIKYAFTLHAPDGTRLMGFDNAHTVPALGGRKKAAAASDHWHRTADDVGRPYKFSDVETLLNDFFDEVERILTELNVPLQVVTDRGKGAKT
ncbi:MAG: hypothetical protein ACLPTF_23935 [Steroidobacteraceae bacterium]